MPDSDVVANNHHDEEVLVSDAESVPDSDGEESKARGGVGQDSNQESIEFGDEDESHDNSSPVKRPGQKVVENQQYDEAVELSSSESVDETDAAPLPRPSAKISSPVGGGHGSKATSGSSGGGSASEGGSSAGAGGAGRGARGGQGHQSGSGDEEESGTSSDDDDEEDGGGGAQVAQGYNPADYANLQVSNEVKELFQYIGRYKPQTIELETKLKPFIPDYIPAIGEIDPFLKMPRPDGQPDKLGLAILDEPAAQQTDPTVLDLQLRAISTQAALQPTVVPSVENAAANPQKITTWMQNMADLHRGNPAPKVDYTRAMPDIEQLMQMWSPEMEEVLEQVQLPSAQLNVDTKAFARIVCAILDIPVYTSLTESLHLLFTLYSEFKLSNQDALMPMNAFDQL